MMRTNGRKQTKCDKFNIVSDHDLYCNDVLYEEFTVNFLASLLHICMYFNTRFERKIIRWILSCVIYGGQRRIRKYIN